MNIFKTTFLLSLLTIILVFLGNLAGGPNGALIALVCAGVMNFFSYWFSDKIVLRMYHAKEAGPDAVPVLHRVVRRLAEKNSIPMPKVYVIEEPSPNAFATGRSPAHASVAATTGILNLLSEKELEGVMAHELAHVMNRDTLISTVAATIAGAITWIAHMAQWGAMFSGGSRDNENRSNVFVMLAVAILAPLAAMIVQMAISRSREYAADETGARFCGDPLALASALGRLQHGAKLRPMNSAKAHTSHLFIVNPFSGGIAGLFSTHPPMEERIRRLQELARQF